ncbi:hypothetical protein EGW08_006977 [Elysia chlorotica]|uniref:Uncharacterized protein n=1 Tax=Elysia chlorotica TaxID=188477 RepID=A0A433TUM3_ELYCH|nr:hypothetical protein EGW08_006977 [Elysia chlorotica]
MQIYCKTKETSPVRMNSSKQKSGIPLAMFQKIKNGSNNAAELDDQQPQHTDRSEKKGPTHLAAAKTKKIAQKNQKSETWADVKVESQSQKMRYQTHSDSSRRKEDIEKQLREAESQIGALTDLIEKREKLLEEERSDEQSRASELEDRLMDQEGILADHGIDPVTGQKVPINEEDKKKVESTKKITKKTVQAMRAKLQEMNRQTESFLADIENTMQYLGSLEDASERAGPFSEETREMIARIANDEETIKQVYNENTKPDKTSAGSGESDDEDADLEEEKGGGDPSQFFITGGSESEQKVVHNTESYQDDTPDAKEMG